jgi:hypothetical protein
LKDHEEPEVLKGRAKFHPLTDLQRDDSKQKPGKNLVVARLAVWAQFV